MGGFSIEIMLIILSAVVIVSYLFSILSRITRMPSVLLLLSAGLVLRALSDANQWGITVPSFFVEMLGVTGLIMIVLEAGLDLKLSKGKLPLIRNSFMAALVIFAVTLAAITGVLMWILDEPFRKCVVYAVPLSIMSSSIVIPSIHGLGASKKEFLVYEASFSDIIGILVFNYFIGNEKLTGVSVAFFSLNILVSVLLSILFSLLLFLFLTRSRMNIKFFMVLALLVVLYVGGKLLHFPSLIIILMFGLLVSNWHLVKIPFLKKLVPVEKAAEATGLLHSITAETSFVIRTFFFLLFGFSIDISVIGEGDVIEVGSLIVVILIVVRYLYLRFFFRGSLFPEVIMIPRGLITILLFYKIPQAYKLETFNEGILFFVILVTALIMMVGMMFYREKADHIIES
ncbi:MAG: sodium:proton exchanger [Chitinophagaceae bacterium]|jgi:Kef-type K+ transport system membrane component KefB|nr:sodium:proton exchanger [Chitinophagaceae bacterium]